MDEERYEINSLLGKGRTGGVYVAEDTEQKKSVAVRRFYSAGGNTSSTDWKEKFVAIAQNLSKLQSPNLLPVVDAGVDEDGAFLVAQLIEGQRLSEFVIKTPLDEHAANQMASQLLHALALSHEAGFIHGALTAGSVMLTDRQHGGYRYIIMDMGLSRLAPLIPGADSSYAMMADPALLAPELFDGKPATAVSDCYMLGHLVYLGLIGGHPFALKSLDAVKELHQSGALPPLSDYKEGISPAFIDWIETLTNPDIAVRPQSAAAALKTLPKLLPKKPATPVEVFATNKPPAPQPSIPTAPERVAPQAKGKKKLILTTTLLLLLIAGVSLAVILPQGNDIESYYPKTPDAKPVNEKLESSTEHANVIELYSIPVSEGYSSIGREVLDKGSLDWVIFRSPLNDWDNSSHPKSDFIKKPSLIGKASDSEKLVGNLSFLDSKKTQIHPNLYAESSDIGDGWRIKILNEKAKSPLTLKLHFTTWNCDAKLRILSADGTVELIPAYEYKRDSLNTSFGSILTLTEELLEDHKSFTLEFTTTEVKSEKPSGLSLNALVVE